MTESDKIFIDDEKFNNTICRVKFILILDNSGKRIYCSYYTKDYDTLNSQLDFENRLCKITQIYSVDKYDLDIFNFEKYNIISRISKEIAIFIGEDEDDNEILLDKVLEAIEVQLFNLIGDELTRENILKHYDELTLTIDELVTNGVVLNIEEHSLYKRVKNTKTEQNNNNNDNKNKSSGGFVSGLFGYFTGKSNDQTPNDQRKEEKEQMGVFGNLMSGAKGYLGKTINY